MALPKFQTTIRELQDLISRWSTILDPIVENPMSNPVFISVDLKAGKNEISHKLGRKLQGWHVTRQKSASTFYDNQDANPNPHLTLIIYSTQAVSVTLGVF